MVGKHNENAGLRHFVLRNDRSTAPLNDHARLTSALVFFVDELYGFELRAETRAKVRQIFRAQNTLFRLFRGIERRVLRFSRELVDARELFFGYDHVASSSPAFLSPALLFLAPAIALPRAGPAANGLNRPKSCP
jgi:hypothetical protein